jgi:hypothetical protein
MVSDMGILTGSHMRMYFYYMKYFKMEFGISYRPTQGAMEFRLRNRIRDALTYISRPFRVSFVSDSITANTISEKHCTAYKCLLPLFHCLLLLFHLFHSDQNTPYIIV